MEKEGDAEFKVFGKEHSLSFNKPTEKPTTRPSESAHTSASTKSESCEINKKRAVALRTDTRWRNIDSTSYTVTTRVCNGANYPQACLHYSSVIAVQPNIGSRLTCTTKALRAPRPIPDIWSNPRNGQHHASWITGWMQSFGVNCERDEFPPAIIWQGRDDDQWIRFLPGSQNGGAGQLFNGICDDTPRSHTTNERMVDSGMQDCRPWESWTRTIWTTFSVLDLQFDLMPGLANYGLAENPCYPLTLVNDPGFALLYEDPYYIARPNDYSYAEDYYPDPPPAAVTQGKQRLPGYNRKRSSQINPNDIVVVDGNSTRKATHQELFENFAIVKCLGDDCAAAKEAFGIESAMMLLPPKMTVPAAAAFTTNSESTVAPVTMSDLEMRMTSSPDLPRVTPHTAMVVDKLHTGR